MVLEVKEHEVLDSEEFSAEKIPGKKKNCFLLNPQSAESERRFFLEMSEGNTFKAGFIIGAQWFNKENAVVINPKMPDIDFMKMFSVCLQSGIESEAFSKIYGIDLDAPMIKVNSLCTDITPLIIIHFLGCVKEIAKKGLKKDYVRFEENLNKVKGRIDIPQNQKKNVSQKRYDKTFCSFQEHSVNTPENRLIKKALLFSQSFFQNAAKAESIKEIDTVLKQCLSAFEEVDGDIQISAVKNIKSNKLYKDYGTALRLAKLILKKYDYSASNISTVLTETPPFWIDMPLLYEHFVLGMLKEAYSDDIVYQYKTAYGWKPDFLHKSQKLILDTKYSLQFNAEGNSEMEQAAVRQLSGYSRTERVRELLGAGPSTVIPCVVIHPIPQAAAFKNIFSETESIISTGRKIDGIFNFYKIAVPLPGLSASSAEAKNIEKLKKQAAGGDAESQKDLGLKYLTGSGIQKSRKKAAQILQQSAAQGNSEAQTVLGTCYLYGKGVPKNEEKALELLQNASDNAQAHFMLGQYYFYHSEQTHSKAVEHYQKSAALGSLSGLYMLADCHFFGYGVPENEAEGRRLYEEYNSRKKLQEPSAGTGSVQSDGEQDLESILENLKDAGTWQERFMKQIWDSPKEETEIYKAAHMTKQSFSKIRSNRNIIPKRETLLCLALAMELDLQKAETFLSEAGYTFSPISPADMIVKDFIRRKKYNIDIINQYLYDSGLEILGNEKNSEKKVKIKKVALS